MMSLRDIPTYEAALSDQTPSLVRQFTKQSNETMRIARKAFLEKLPRAVMDATITNKEQAAIKFMFGSMGSAAN